MPRRPLFAGLVIDERDNPVETAYVGDEPCYVVNDAGFRRHIPSAQVDRQVLEKMRQQINGNEALLSEQASKMLGAEDIFSKALIEQQFKTIDQRLEDLIQVGIPAERRAYMGMLGFKIIINVHGEVVRLEQPAAADEGGDGE